MPQTKPAGILQPNTEKKVICQIENCPIVIQNRLECNNLLNPPPTKIDDDAEYVHDLCKQPEYLSFKLEDIPGCSLLDSINNYIRVQACNGINDRGYSEFSILEREEEIEKIKIKQTIRKPEDGQWSEYSSKDSYSFAVSENSSIEDEAALRNPEFEIPNDSDFELFYKLFEKALDNLTLKTSSGKVNKTGKISEIYSIELTAIYQAFLFGAKEPEFHDFETYVRLNQITRDIGIRLLEHIAKNVNKRRTSFKQLKQEIKSLAVKNNVMNLFKELKLTPQSMNYSARNKLEAACLELFEIFDEVEKLQKLEKLDQRYTLLQRILESPDKPINKIIPKSNQIISTITAASFRENFLESKPTSEHKKS